jgi:hypothetical protein
VDDKDGEELNARLAQALSEKLGREIKFED